MVQISVRNTKVYKIREICRAIFSAFYNISQVKLNVGIVSRTLAACWYNLNQLIDVVNIIVFGFYTIVDNMQ